MKINEIYPDIKPREDGLIYLEVLTTPEFRLTGLLWKDKNKTMASFILSELAVEYLKLNELEISKIKADEK